MCVVLATNHAHCSLRVRFATGGPEGDGGAMVEVHLGHPFAVDAIRRQDHRAHMPEARLEIAADAKAGLPAFPVKRIILADDAVPLEIVRPLELLDDVAANEHAALAPGDHVEEPLMAVQIPPVIDVIPAVDLRLVDARVEGRPPL